jgi:hypothetical protein
MNINLHHYLEKGKKQTICCKKKETNKQKNEILDYL